MDMSVYTREGKRQELERRLKKRVQRGSYDEATELTPEQLATRRNELAEALRRPSLLGRSLTISKDDVPREEIMPPLTRIIQGFIKLYIIENEDFELLVILLIFANCVSLAMYLPLEGDDSPHNKTLEVVELTFNALFTLEMLLRIAAEPRPLLYFADSWNAFDALLVIIGYSSLLPAGQGSGASGIRAVRALRALRPLRTITRFQALRAVVVCFMEAVPLLVSVVGLLFFFLFLFAIAGLQMFQDSYHQLCVSSETREPEFEMEDEFGCVMSGSDGRECPASYECYHQDRGTGYEAAGFDHIGTSMLTVWQCTTLAGWSQIMYRVVDTTSMFSVGYFMILIFFGPYFVVNLFLAVLKTKFGKAQSLFTSKVDLSSSERRRNSLQVGAERLKMFFSAGMDRARERRNTALQTGELTWTMRVQEWLKNDVVEEPWFSNFFLFCIYLNTVLLAVEYDGMSPKLAEGLDMTNLVLTGLFTVELGVKVFAYGLMEYLSDGFNVFDGVIVLLSLFEIIAVGGSTISAMRSLRSVRSLRVLKTFRVLRVFKMFRYLQSLRIIGEVLVSSMSSFISIALLLFLFLLVFAVVGLHVYGGSLSTEERESFVGTQDRAQFDTFFLSVVSIFQVLTLEDWEFVMFDTIEFGNWGAAVYFVLWIIIGKYIFLTLFLAVTLEAFESKYDSEASQEVRALARSKGLGAKKVSKVQRRSRRGSITQWFMGRGSTDDNDEAGDGQQKESRDSEVPEVASSPPSKIWGSSPDDHERRSEDLLHEPAVSDETERVRTFGRLRNRRMSIEMLALYGRDDDDDYDPEHVIANLQSQASKAHMSFAARAASGFPSSVNRGMSMSSDNVERLDLEAPTSSYGASMPVRATSSSHIDVESQPGTVRDSHAQEDVLSDVLSTALRVSTSTNDGDGTSAFYREVAKLADFEVKKRSLDGGSRPLPANMDIGPVRRSGGGERRSGDGGSRPLRNSSDGGSRPLRNSGDGGSRPLRKSADGGSRPLPGPVMESTELVHDVSSADLVSMNAQAEESSLVQMPVSEHRFDSRACAWDSDGIDAQGKGEYDPDPTPFSSNITPFEIIHEAKTPRSEANQSLNTPLRTTIGGSTETDLALLNAEAVTQQLNFEKVMVGYSLGFIPPYHPVRVFFYGVTQAPMFDNFFFLLVFISCVTMAMEHPDLDPDSTLGVTLRYFDIGLCAFFGVEMLMKLIPGGVSFYVQSSSNCLDGVIVFVTILLLALETSSDFRAVRSLRVLRAIRPLRALTRSSGMRVVLRSVSLSIAAMVNVSIVCLMFFFVFGILGVQLFSGRFYRCNDTTVAGKDECVGSFYSSETGQLVKRDWSNAFLNFDHLGQALITLFVTATLDGYIETMYNALDVTEKDMQPQKNANPGAFVYFLCFITLCAFSLLNLYVGVIFYQFSRIRLLSQTSSCFLTEEQKEWSEISKMALRLTPIIRPPRPKGFFPRFCWTVVKHNSFEPLILSCIVLNVCFMATEHYGQTGGWEGMLYIANVVFTAIFMLEAVLKLVGHGYRLYFKSGWNRFDFVIVVAAVFDLAELNFISASFVRLVRLFRVTRMFRLVKALKGIKALFETLIVSLPAFWNVGALLALLFFIYAYIGVMLFSGVVPGENLNEHANFESFGMALLTLFRVATNDEWVGVMQDCMVSPPSCSRAEGNCGNRVAYLYFISFVIIVSIILLNLFTAVIIENFEKLQDREGWKLSPSFLEDFKDLWSDYDDGSNTILVDHLEDIVRGLPPPIGLRGTGLSDVFFVTNFASALDITIDANGRVGFHRTIFELCRRVSGCELPPGEMRTMLERLVYKVLTAEDTLSSTPNSSRPSSARRSSHSREATPEQHEGVGDDIHDMVINPTLNIVLIVLSVQRRWRKLVMRRRQEREEAERLARGDDSAPSGMLVRAQSSRFNSSVALTDPHDSAEEAGDGDSAGSKGLVDRIVDFGRMLSGKDLRSPSGDEPVSTPSAPTQDAVEAFSPADADADGNGEADTVV